jgi:hypothetical protein
MLVIASNVFSPEVAFIVQTHFLILSNRKGLQLQDQANTLNVEIACAINAPFSPGLLSRSDFWNCQNLIPIIDI